MSNVKMLVKVKKHDQSWIVKNSYTKLANVNIFVEIITVYDLLNDTLNHFDLFCMLLVNFTIVFTLYFCVNDWSNNKFLDEI